MNEINSNFIKNEIVKIFGGSIQLLEGNEIEKMSF